MGGEGGLVLALDLDRDLMGELMHISDPLPGKTHDAKAVTDTGLLEILDSNNAIADKGYIGTGVITPVRKPAGGELLDWQKEFNTVINKMRYVVERVIANFKTWRIMHTDYRLFVSERGEPR